MFILGLPIILVADRLLYLWLGIVPEYAVVFLQLVLIQSLFSVFDTSFYTALYARGRLRENALISPTIGFLGFPIVYILFKNGYSPVVLSYAGIISYALLGFVVKPALIIKIADYSIGDVISVFVPCIKVSIIAVIIPLLLKRLLDDSILSAVLISFASVVSVIGCVYLVGIDRNIHFQIQWFIKNKFITKKKYR
jgi:hypothetical protein